LPMKGRYSRSMVVVNNICIIVDLYIYLWSLPLCEPLLRVNKIESMSILIYMKINHFYNVIYS
jgi:hypothetical protein